jgi:hypothetical protein
MRYSVKDLMKLQCEIIDKHFHNDYGCAGALMGAIVYVIPITVFALEQGSSYYLTWIVFGYIAGVYSPISSVIIAGFSLHILVATSIGIV